MHNNYTVDALLICVDFEAMRNHQDVECMSSPKKIQKKMVIQLFLSPRTRLISIKVLYGPEGCPILTIVIGGNHEASNDPCAAFTTSANTVRANSPSWVKSSVAWILNGDSISQNSALEIEFSYRTTGLNTFDKMMMSKTYSNPRALLENPLRTASSVLHPSWNFGKLSRLSGGSPHTCTRVLLQQSNTKVFVGVQWLTMRWMPM
jgi:hypothetical protein